MFYSEEETKKIWEHTFAYLKVREESHILYITLARPEAKNAMSPTMVKEYSFALAYAHYEANIWAVVFGAEGNIWCAGADLKAMRGKEEDNNSSIPKPHKELVIGEVFAGVHKPLIARVHAPVYAGGHLIIGSCNFVVASAGVHFNLPEVKRGIFPFQVMDILLKTLPPRRVLNWCIEGGRVEAKKAYEWGLITHIVDSEADLDEQVQALCTHIFENSPSAIRLGMKAFDALRSIPEADKQAYLKKILDETIKTQDAQEGLRAFAEKRKPQWTGK